MITGAPRVLMAQRLTEYELTLRRHGVTDAHFLRLAVAGFKTGYAQAILDQEQEQE